MYIFWCGLISAILKICDFSSVSFHRGSTRFLKDDLKNLDNYNIILHKKYFTYTFKNDHTAKLKLMMRIHIILLTQRFYENFKE